MASNTVSETRPMNPTQRHALAVEAFQQIHPDAVAVVRSKPFQQWLDRQSVALRKVFANGTSPADAFLVMDAYKASRLR